MTQRAVREGELEDAAGAGVPLGSSYGTPLRLAVYSMLVVSAVVTVLFSEHLWSVWRAGSIPVWAPLTAPVAFGAFVLVYAVDRYLLVRRRRYPASRALFQVALCLIFLTLLLPPPRPKGKEAEPLPSTDAPALLLLVHAEAPVRAAACAVLGGTLSPEVYNQVQSMVHHDPEEPVRLSCAAALQRLHAAAAQQAAPILP